MEPGELYDKDFTRVPDHVPSGNDHDNGLKYLVIYLCRFHLTRATPHRDPIIWYRLWELSVAEVFNNRSPHSQQQPISGSQQLVPA